ncbi:Outer membrane efflux protein [Rosistilla ulvae]|uniref:Outer membrane efflux protein n=1 Tax=Rosistilla ulvae TaxID=1930277 RepID=A0A517M769_9BACT|nr:TolC family protein [Rosistilla ulvae]QDS90713.1 Outer membrane efflux protein [Rosistilla ulvae]
MQKIPFSRSIQTISRHCVIAMGIVTPWMNVAAEPPQRLPRMVATGIEPAADVPQRLPTPSLSPTDSEEPRVIGETPEPANLPRVPGPAVNPVPSVAPATRTPLPLRLPPASPAPTPRRLPHTKPVAEPNEEQSATITEPEPIGAPAPNGPSDPPSLRPQSNPPQSIGSQKNSPTGSEPIRLVEPDVDSASEEPTPSSYPSTGMSLELPRQPRPAVATPTLKIAGHHALPDQLPPMWWNAEVRQSVGIGPATLPISIDRLVQSALANSTQIQSLLTEPRIRRATVAVEQAQFDWQSFVESQFDDKSDPIGSILTTGSADGRFEDKTWSAAAGLRQTNRIGGKLELAQNGGHQRNNSQFLIPNPQGTTRLEVNYTQPLLSGAGRFVNESRIVLAQLDYRATNDRTQAQIQDHLIDVTNAYWELYLGRSHLLQRRKLLESARQIYDTLRAREGVDVLQRQILRAQVAVTGREAEVIRAQTEIRNSQSRLRRLINDPELVAAMQLEWTPQDQPLDFRIDISASASAQIALASRPEIAEAMRRVKALSVQADVARNEILPRLDLLLRTYVAGLEDNADTLGSWNRQWTDGRPTYGVGMLYEFPIGNRAAKGRLKRSRLELTREILDFESTIEQTLLEVDIAVRETQTAYREMVSKQNAVFAAAAEVQFLDERWRTLPTQQDSAVLLLENLLDAQQRLGNEEAAYATAQVTYALSWISLRRAMGTLLSMDQEPIAEIPSPGAPDAAVFEDPAATSDEQPVRLPATARAIYDRHRQPGAMLR